MSQRTWDSGDVRFERWWDSEIIGKMQEGARETAPGRLLGSDTMKQAMYRGWKAAYEQADFPR
jgi:hypothetical protein